VGGALLASPLFLSIAQGNPLSSLAAKASDYELTNEVQAGQFRSSTHKGDTTTSPLATFYGISILTSPRLHLSLKNEAKAKVYVQSLESREFNRNIEETYQGILLLKRLATFQPKKAEKYYKSIMELAEPNSGFRLDSMHSASVQATYFAFKAIEELGKFDDFKATEQYSSALNFVSSLREESLGGFSDVAGQNATLEATYYALRILPASENTTAAERFVYACQAQDGGFSNEPIDSLARYYYTQSDLISTIQGLYILQQLGVTTSSPFDFSSPVANAKAFAQSNLSGASLQATYYLLDLINSFPSFSFGASKIVQFSVMSVAGLFFVAALIAFYKPQIPDEAFSGSKSHFQFVFVLLVVGAITTFYFPSFSVFPYLALSLYLVVQYYETQQVDTTDGVMILVACVNSLVYMALAASFVYFSPFVYGQALTFVILLGWFLLATFLTTYGACFFVPKQTQRLSFFVKAGFLAWITNTFMLFMFLHGRGDMSVFYRLVTIRGIYPIVFVAFPLLSLLLSYFASATGYLVFKSK